MDNSQKNWLIAGLVGLFVGLSVKLSGNKTTTNTGTGTTTAAGLDKNRPSGVTFAVFNRNLGNIKNAGRKYAGEITPTGNIFKKFDTWENSAAAMVAHLQRYIAGRIFGKLDTVTKIINVYAPPSENNSTAYVNFVCNATGFTANQVLDWQNKETMWKLSKAMSRMEDSKATVFYTEAVFNKAWVTAQNQNG